MGELFGTDGVRGVANTELTPELAMAIARATVAVISTNMATKPKILIGKDTRISSDMLEAALAAGICSMGADAVMLGFIPTPAVAFLIGELGATAGIVVSASHNPMEFNGIKVLGQGGLKLDDELEEKIEAYIKNESQTGRPIGREIGSISFSQNAEEIYVKHLVESVDVSLKGIKVAVDCANGASYMVAQKVFGALEIDAVFTAVNPDGVNINDNVGSTHMDNIVETTLKDGCDVGIAYDGDADRCLAVDEVGNIINGDKLIAIFAKEMKIEGNLAADTAVVTVMSNLGFYEFCKDNGINVVTTAVGDRQVLEAMLEHGYSVGGEESGHIILSEYATTGDGILTSLKLLSCMAKTGKKASELANEIPVYPQILKSVSATPNQKDFFNKSQEIKTYLADVEKAVAESGRILVRCSGTEPIIRVLVEGKHQQEIESITDDICSQLNIMLAGVE
ncbi:MAG: phosphoglucosamine mutase [Oscillospiraceae bacterium]|nr:phosphoglucosamine mutase [Oscillospiraceae bacterium]